MAGWADDFVEELCLEFLGYFGFYGVLSTYTATYVPNLLVYNPTPPYEHGKWQK